MRTINKIEHTSIDDMYANELAKVVGMTRTEKNCPKKSDIEIAKQLKLEQFLIDTIYKAERQMNLPVSSIEESMINAIKNFKIQRKESVQIAGALS